MKRINRIRIKYFSLFFFFLVLATVVPTFMRYQATIEANAVGYAKETRSSTYTINFYSNGGTGSMQSITADYNIAKALTANSFTLDSSNFLNWNTQADGSGDSYADGQEILLTDYIDGDEINLYAQWSSGVSYTVVYDANGGTGTVESQTFIYDVAQNLRANAFTKENSEFVNWNTRADGKGTSYDENEEVINLTDVSGEVITLYAIYSSYLYEYAGDVVFDGTAKFDGKAYIDTNIYLFSEENIDKDFEVSFEIKQRNSTYGQATMMSAMDETGSPWPGITYRVSSSVKDNYSTNASSSESLSVDVANSNITKVAFKRINNSLYIQFNDGDETEILNMSLMTKTFDVPVTFGASLNGSLNPQRLFSGTLANLKVMLKDRDYTVGSIKFNANSGKGAKFSQTIAPNTPTALMANTYTKSGYAFNGWNTKANGTGTSYEDQEIVTNIVGAGEDVTLYAQWLSDYCKITFNSNGGTGSMSTQTISTNVNATLNKSTFEKEGYNFAFWNTKANGSGTTYQDEDTINFSDTAVTLYAIYEKYSYTYEGDCVFDGDDYINTDIYLFSAKNYQKDFEISFKIKSATYTKNQNTILSAMNELGSPYQGFVFRMYNGSQNYELEANSISSLESHNLYGLDSIENVVIKRVNNILYININNAGDTQILDYSSFSKPFYYPLTIGAGLNESFAARRFLNGTLSDISVTLSE